MAQLNWKETVKYDGKLIAAIRAQQNAFRGVGIIPSWENFMQTEVYHEMCQELPSDRERSKFREWWKLFYELCRHPRDKETVTYAVAILVRERMRRSYSKTMPVIARAFGILDEVHAHRVEEFCLTNFEALT